MIPLHLQPVARVLPVILGDLELVASAFALPVLLSRDAAAELTRENGHLPDATALAQCLHEDVGLGAPPQCFYAFHRLIDAPTLGRLVAPRALETITGAMCLDGLTLARGGTCQLDGLIPLGRFDRAPVGFVLGAVFMDPSERAPLLLPRQGWWTRSSARGMAEDILAAQFAELGLPMPAECLPRPPAPLPQALADGLATLLTSQSGTGHPRVLLEGADTVHVQLGDSEPRAHLSLSRSTVGDQVIEDLLQELIDHGKGTWRESTMH